MKNWLCSSCIGLVFVVSAGCSSTTEVGRVGALPANAGTSPDDVPAGPAPVAWGACDASTWSTEMPPPPKDLECASIDVPRDPDSAGDETVTLRVARQRARQQTRAALFQVAGGPGGSSVEQAGLVGEIFKALRDEIDFVYVDQRGTGGSGYLDCPGGYPDTEAGWKTCVATLDNEKLAHHRSAIAAADLDAVRARLGYPKILVRAGSYGTHVALELLRRNETVVEAAVLDGAAPPDVDFLGWVGEQLSTGIEWLVRDCDADVACVAVSPSLRSDLLARRAALKDSPRPITIGGASDFETDEVFLTALQAALYAPGLRQRVPRAVHEAVKGDPTQWDAVMSTVFGQTVKGPHKGPDYVAPGLWITITCAEFFPLSGGTAAIEALEAAQEWPTARAGAYARVCAGSGIPPVDAAFRAPVTSNAKVLLLSGEIDLRTPPAWGDHAAKTLPRARHVVVKGAMHGVITTPCGAKLASSFLRTRGDASSLDISCATEVASAAW